MAVRTVSVPPPPKPPGRPLLARLTSINRRQLLLIAVVALFLILVGRCAFSPGETPASVTQAALDRVVAHDLVGASTFVCTERRDPADLPFPLPGILGPVQAMPGFDVRRTLTVMTLDATKIQVVEESRSERGATVRVRGPLVERYDPVAVEALFRAYAAESGQAFDATRLQETLASVSNGDVTIQIDEVVPVGLQDNKWRVCPAAPTP